MRYLMMICFCLVAFVVWQTLYIVGRYSGMPYWAGLVGSFVLGWVSTPFFIRAWKYLPKS
jgi:hypothetical protein